MSIHIEIGSCLYEAIKFGLGVYSILIILKYFMEYIHNWQKSNAEDTAQQIARQDYKYRAERQERMDKIKLENSKSEKLEYNQLKKQLDLIEEKLTKLSCTNSK